jgi:hypothetical protein
LAYHKNLRKLGRYGYFTKGRESVVKGRQQEAEEAIKDLLIELQEERGLSFDEVYQGAFIGFSEYLIVKAGDYDRLASSYRYVEAAHDVACQSLENAFAEAKNLRLN